MSRTYDIACHDCKVKLWIGQGSGDSAYLYTTQEHLKAMRDFLFFHQRHELEFGDDEPMALDDYKALDDDEDA